MHKHLKLGIPSRSEVEFFKNFCDTKFEEILLCGSMDWGWAQAVTWVVFGGLGCPRRWTFLPLPQTEPKLDTKSTASLLVVFIIMY